MKKKPKGLILHEVLKRSASYMQEYELWKSSDLPKVLLNDISTSLELKAKGIDKTPEVHAFTGEYSNGLAITYNPEIDKDHFRFLFDLLAHKVLTQGYKISIKDLMITEKKEYLETKEKYYLKVLPANRQPIDQKYGNITVELILINDKPSFIRLMAHAYNDRLYQPPLNFENLKHCLLNQDNSEI